MGVFLYSNIKKRWKCRMMWHWRLAKTTSCTGDIILHSSRSKETQYMLGVLLDRSTYWNLVSINSWDIVGDDESTNGIEKGGKCKKKKKKRYRRMELWARICRLLPIHTKKISFSAVEWTISLSSESELMHRALIAKPFPCFNVNIWHLVYINVLLSMSVMKPAN